MTIPLMMITESTQENIMQTSPVHMTHGYAALTDSDTSITNAQIDNYEADLLQYQQSLYAEEMGWVDDHAQEEGMAHDESLPEP